MSRIVAKKRRRVSATNIAADAQGLQTSADLSSDVCRSGVEFDNWAPPLPSKAAELLQMLPPRESDTWASRALRTVLMSEQDDEYGVLLFHIAVTDAWTEDDDTFCVVYTPPYGPDLVGVRRQRGDKRRDPWLQARPDHPDYPEGFDPTIWSPTPDAADEFGWLVCDDIGESLGLFGHHLRYDANGLGWWGTLGEHPPTRPAPPRP